ncbi:RNA polymerase sigma factor [Pedobacter sp. GR22-6]|uniref:RNA polymerase sigma factor n=1 Tax=Pedobacter sp. GR22-6 TaxID=3127957 RepID=UPI00307FC435
MLDRNTSDDELWEAIKDGNVRSFELLFDRYWQAVYTTAFSFLNDAESAAEIANDTFLNIWRKKETLTIGAFKNYLTTSARYHTYKVLKAKKKLRLSYVENYDQVPASLIAVQNEAEEKIRCLNIQEDIERALIELPKRCREIFLLSRIGNLSNGEIAEKLSISKRTVENQISIAQKYLEHNMKNIALTLLLIGILK